MRNVVVKLMVGGVEWDGVAKPSVQLARELVMDKPKYCWIYGRSVN